MLRKRRRILLADDDEVTRAVLASMLQLFNLEVDEVADGCEVVKAFSVNSYDVILMDLKMRPMDGVTASLFVRLKEHETRRRTPIIAMTAFSARDCREACLAAGINAYVAKPVDLKELLLLMETLIHEQDLAAPETQEPERCDLKIAGSHDSGRCLWCEMWSQRGAKQAKIAFVPSIAIPYPAASRQSCGNVSHQK